VVKIAYNSDDCKTLCHEAEIYGRLHKNRVSGIPQCFGYFEGDGSSALVVSNAGQSFHNWDEVQQLSEPIRSDTLLVS
jgi:hypothetical protein